MIGTVMIAAALLAFGWQSWLYLQYKKYDGRRGLIGCEVARQLLDLMSLPQVAIRPIGPQEKQQPAPVKQLLLEGACYESRSLLAIAQAARQAVALSKMPDLFSGVLLPLRRPLYFLILPAWLAVLWGALSGFEAVKVAGLSLLGIVFILGVLDFLHGSEINKQAYELLKKTGCFEPDEIVKLRHLLEALRLEGPAKIFRAPWNLVANLIAQKETNGV